MSVWTDFRMNGSEGPLSEGRADYVIAKPGMTIKSRSISPVKPSKYKDTKSGLLCKYILTGLYTET